MTDEVQVPVADASAPLPETVVVETPVVETPTIETPVEVTPTENTILGDDTVEAPVENPIEETPVEAPVENEGETQSEEPAPVQPTYDAFTLPDGIDQDNEMLIEFKKDLGDLELKTKADHAVIEELGQKFVDKYIAEVAKVVEHMNQHHKDEFENKKNQWKEDFEKDPVLGGNRKDTTISNIKQLIRTHGGDEAQRQSLSEFMNETGVGNHPVLIGFLNRLSSGMQEGKPLPAQTPPQPKLSKVEKRYGMK